ncbi:unnamed protein product [Psylliodes chrysocephalus]|uniref:Uncharacterized protein n=1 Tax=Psylliodes chrysocephalus TaxID=3402493 RepID=A0A9P0D990_9CUCU|nr:unnamed protein product [Psylliodes chrysocephala]
MTELQKLVKERGTYKSRLTIFEKFVNSLVASLDDENKILKKEQIFDLENKIARVEEVMHDFNKVQTEIEIIDETANELQLQERELFENKYDSLVGISKALIEDSREVEESKSLENNSNKSSYSRSGSNVSIRTGVDKR